MPWDPAHYKKFAAERFAPFRDLLTLVDQREGLDVIDLGCGSGELTRALADALPRSQVLGVDSSAEMLADAAPLARPGLRFELGRIESLLAADRKWDLIFSHAALHWVEDHEQLFPRLLERLRPAGQLAVQMPANHEHPSHQLLAALVREPPFAAALAGYARASPVLRIAAYAEWLDGAGARELTVIEKVYPHRLADAVALADWMRGTALVPYLERLDEALAAALLARYRERLAQRFPARPLFFGFNRILIAAKHA